MHYVILQQQLGKIRPILTSDPGDESNFVTRLDFVVQNEIAHDKVILVVQISILIVKYAAEESVCE